MTIGQSMLPEFDQEMQNTRKVLERASDEKWGWKPHEKSGTVGWLAGHVATMPGWIGVTLKTEELDYAPVGGPAYEPPKNRKPAAIAGRVRQECGRSARSAGRRERCRHNEGLDASGWWHENFHDAEDRVHPQHGAEPHHSSPGTAHGVLPPARNSCAGPLRAKRG